MVGYWLFFERHQNHLPALIHKTYLYYLKAISVQNVTNDHLLFTDMLNL